MAFVERVAEYCRTKNVEIHQISAGTADLQHEVRRVVSVMGRSLPR